MICKQFPWQSLRNKWCLISQGLVAADFNTIRKNNTLQGISWLQEFSSTCLCAIHQLFSCIMVASGNRSPSLWCMKLSRTGVPPLCQISLVFFSCLGNRLLLGLSNSSISNPHAPQLVVKVLFPAESLFFKHVSSPDQVLTLEGIKN